MFKSGFLTVVISFSLGMTAALAQSTPGGVHVPEASGIPPGLRFDNNGSAQLPPQFNAGSVQLPPMRSTQFYGNGNNMPAFRAPPTLPSGIVNTPSGTVPTRSGSVPLASGSVRMSSGSVAMPSGSVPQPSGSVPMPSGVPRMR
jgi:hypothetical protein